MKNFLFYIQALRIIFFLVTAVQLTGCGSQKYEEFIPGTWEGESSDGLIWCVRYSGKRQLHAYTRTDSTYVSNSGEKMKSGEIIEFKGKWDLKKGGRLSHSFKAVNKISVSGELFSRVAVADAQVLTNAYFLIGIDERFMQYRAVNDKKKWFKSKRVERCSAKFSPN